MSAEQVVEQMFDESEGEENSEEVNVGERLKRGLSSALIDGEVDKELFLSSCAHILEPLYKLCRVGVQEAFGQGARVLASHPIHASTILKDEVRLWLKAIHRRLARKAGYRNAYRGQISRDMPRQIWRAFLLPQRQQKYGSCSLDVHPSAKRAVCVIVWPSCRRSYILFQKNPCIWVKKGAQSLAYGFRGKRFYFYVQQKPRKTVNFVLFWRVEC